VSVFAKRTGELLQAELEGWIRREDAVDLALLKLGEEQPSSYAFQQARATVDGRDVRRELFARWLAGLQRARLDRLVGGVLALRHSPGPVTPAYVEVDIETPRSAQPDVVGRLFAGLRGAHEAVFADELLARIVRLGSDLSLNEERLVRAGSLVTTARRARAARLPLAPVELSEDLYAVFRAVDGRRTLAAAIQRASADGAFAASMPRLLEGVRACIRRGLLVVETRAVD
jgi:hypothetical protein